jgi:hypothetical protein
LLLLYSGRGNKKITNTNPVLLRETNYGTKEKKARTGKLHTGIFRWWNDPVKYLGEIDPVNADRKKTPFD